MENSYYDDDWVQSRVEAGQHRDIIGGLWEEVGALQLRFLLERGLRPSDRVLDVGCGALRAGVKLVPYLDPGNYFGIDIRQELLDAGYDHEVVPAGLAERLPRDNLRASRDFSAQFAAPIDVGIAQSVFTHLSFNHLRWCLEALHDVVRPGGEFFATYFEVPDDASFGMPLGHSPGGIVTYPAKDPYHYRAADIVHAAYGTKWVGEVLGEWGHPRDQRMARFVHG